MLVRAPVREVRNWYCDSRRWDGYQPRDGDVVIATPPKVGTTWTQQIVNLLIFKSAEPRSLSMSPWIDARFREPIEMVLPVIEAQTHRRFLKSHLPFDGLPIYDEVKYIHVARGGRDACMSYHNHINGYRPSTLEALDAVGLGDPTIGKAYPRSPSGTRDFFHHWMQRGEDSAKQLMSPGFFEIERSFWKERARPNLLLVHYNDLKADLRGEMGRIATFLDIEIPDALWPELVDATTMDSMKRDGETLLPGMDRGFEGGVKTFLNKGTNGRWQGELTEEDNADFLARLDEELTPGLIAWLENGRRVAGDPKVSAD